MFKPLYYLVITIAHPSIANTPKHIMEVEIVELNKCQGTPKAGNTPLYHYTSYFIPMLWGF